MTKYEKRINTMTNEKLQPTEKLQLMLQEFKKS